MKKEQYYNTVTAQVKDLSNLAGIQADLCFDESELEKILSRDECKKIRRVILTGCGDSYSAAGAMLPGFRLLSGIKKINSPDIMDFCHYYTEKKIKKEFEMEEVLVVLISFSGESQRVVDALERANQYGAQSLLITRNPKSKGAETAGHVFDVKTPDGCNSPGLRSYYASMVALTALAAYIGMNNGTIKKERFLQVKEQIAAYTLNVMDCCEEIDDLMFQQAVRMKDLTKFEIIADGNEGYSGQFVEEKLIECGGVYCDHTTSEEFVHISIMFRSPAEYGTIIMVNEADPSLSRMKDTLIACLGQHRPTVIVTDASPEVFAFDPKNPRTPVTIDMTGYNSMLHAGVPVICRLPKAPEQWMSPFVDFIPGSLLAGYQAAVNEKKYFGGRYDFRTQQWSTV